MRHLPTLIALLLMGILTLAWAVEPTRIQVKRGLESKLPAKLAMGEPAFTTDTHRVFFGYSTGKEELLLRNRFLNYTGVQALRVAELWSSLAGKAATTHTQPASSITGLAAVATSGAYADLTGKPATANRTLTPVPGPQDIDDPYEVLLTDTDKVFTTVDYGIFWRLPEVPLLSQTELHSYTFIDNIGASLMFLSDIPTKSLTEVYLPDLVYPAPDIQTALSLVNISAVQIPGGCFAAYLEGELTKYITSIPNAAARLAEITYAPPSLTNGDPNGSWIVTSSDFAVTTEPEPSSAETQATILDKIKTPNDGATLIVQQGPSEPATTPKMIVKDSVGATRMTVFADGSIGIE